MLNTAILAADTGLSFSLPQPSAVTDLQIVDALDGALARLHALRLTVEALSAPDGDGQNALVWIAGEALAAVNKIRNDVDARRGNT